jgi:hypothetical protein
MAAFPYSQGIRPATLSRGGWVAGDRPLIFDARVGGRGGASPAIHPRPPGLAHSHHARRLRRYRGLLRKLEPWTRSGRATRLVHPSWGAPARVVGSPTQIVVQKPPLLDRAEHRSVRREPDATPPPGDVPARSPRRERPVTRRVTTLGREDPRGRHSRPRSSTERRDPRGSSCPHPILRLPPPPRLISLNSLGYWGSAQGGP